ncbi:invasion associated locus B family protein [uncultured Agrobacterium sp.]|uniref:invasion associated locus B family protein n=1 Tax=uncultured Agrobacterium sp. TaxID=157277 RepID=UPI0025E1A8A4|nr:invasion associated locus B family protein [uncultured Agrobacterium sp.]
MMKKTWIQSFATLLLCGVFAGGAPATPSIAQDKKEERVAVSSEPGATTATYGNWVLQCVRAGSNSALNTQKTCEVMQSIQVQGQAQPVAQIALGRVTKDAKLQLTVVLPVNITPGKLVMVTPTDKASAADKSGLQLSWARCIGAACFATIEPTPEFLASVRSSQEGRLSYVDGTGQGVELPLSWNGVTQALAALEKAS